MDQVENSLTWRLNDPGMGLLERAGLAALYMSLTAAEEHTKSLAPLSWTKADLTADSVTVRWTGAPKAAFVALFEWAWQARDGVLYLPGVHRDSKLRDNAFLRVPMHNGITRTFLQHPRVQPKGDLIKRIERLDEDREIEIAYQPLDSQQLKPLVDLSRSFFTRQGTFSDESISLSNWVFPGIAGRFGGEPSWNGGPALGLLLMLAPAACLYQQLHAERGTWLLVVPDVVDLIEFDERRPTLKVDPAYTDVASLSDAAMQFISAFATTPPRRELAVGCRVVAMGRVGYYPSQSIRKGVADVSPAPVSLRRFRILQRIMAYRYIRRKLPPNANSSGALPGGHGSDAANERHAEGWISLPTGRGRIADNLVENRAWYADLFEPLPWDRDALDRQRKKARVGVSIERLWFDNLAHQRGRLMELIQEGEMWNTPGERMFVEAFWQILSALYRQEVDAVERGGARKIEERLQDLNEDLRRRITRAKTRPLLRETILDLFAKPVETYRSPIVRQHPALVWSLLDDAHEWKRARDLALLALVSYQSKEKREAGRGASSVLTAAELPNEDMSE